MISGNLPEAIDYYEQAFTAMGEVYTTQSAVIQPWYADMGAVIGEKHLLLDQAEDAEAWFRHVPSFAPFNLRATQGLAGVLLTRGDTDEADRLCTIFEQRIGVDPCAARAQERQG